MKKIIFLMMGLICCGVLSGQNYRLKYIETDSARFTIPVAAKMKVIAGDTSYQQIYMSLADLMDSLHLYGLILEDMDGDSTNEIQYIERVGESLQLTTVDPGTAVLDRTVLNYSGELQAPRTQVLESLLEWELDGGTFSIIDGGNGYFNMTTSDLKMRKGSGAFESNIEMGSSGLSGEIKLDTENGEIKLNENGVTISNIGLDVTKDITFNALDQIIFNAMIGNHFQFNGVPTGSTLDNVALLSSGQLKQISSSTFIQDTANIPGLQEFVENHSNSGIDSTLWAERGADAMESKKELVGINIDPTYELDVRPRSSAVDGDTYVRLGDGTDGFLMRKPSLSNEYAGQFFGVWKWWNGSSTSIFEDESGSQGTSGQVWGRKGSGAMGWVDDDSGTDSQSLSFTSPNLSISGGNSVDLSALQDGTGTDNQTLSFTNPNLSISGGNSQDLSTINYWQKDGSNNLYYFGGGAIGVNVLPDPNYSITTNSNIKVLTLEVGSVGSTSMIFGNGAMSNSVSSNCVAIGQDALENNAGSNSVGVGKETLEDATGGNNVAIGLQNAQNVNTQNVSIGTFSLSTSTGSYNTTAGYAAGSGSGVGSYNTLLGWRTGHGLTGSGNIIIGTNLLGSYATWNNKLMIDNANSGSSSLIFGDFATNELTVNGELHATDLTGGTATHGLYRDATNQIVEGDLPLTDVEVGTVSSNQVDIVDQAGTVMYTWDYNDANFDVSESPANQVNVVHKSNGGHLFDALETFTADGYFNFSTSDDAGTVTADDTTDDDLTTSAVISANFSFSGSYTTSGTCGSGDQLQIEIRQNGANVKEVVVTAELGNGVLLPFVVNHQDLNFTTSDAYKVYVRVPSSGTCDISIYDAQFQVSGF